MSFYLIRGPGGSGKTTIAKHLVEHLRTTRKAGLISADTFYWDISGRDPNPKIMYGALDRLTDLYLSEGYDFVVEGILTRLTEDGKPIFMNLIDIAKKNNVGFQMFNLTADVNTLREREINKFRQNGWTFKEETFMGWYTESQKTIQENEIQIDTTNKTISQIFDEMKEYL